MSIFDRFVEQRRSRFAEAPDRVEDQAPRESVWDRFGSWRAQRAAANAPSPGEQARRARMADPLAWQLGLEDRARQSVANNATGADVLSSDWRMMVSPLIALPLQTAYRSRQQMLGRQKQLDEASQIVQKDAPAAGTPEGAIFDVRRWDDQRMPDSSFQPLEDFLSGVDAAAAFVNPGLRNRIAYTDADAIDQEAGENWASVGDLTASFAGQLAGAGAIGGAVRPLAAPIANASRGLLSTSGVSSMLAGGAAGLAGELGNEVGSGRDVNVGNIAAGGAQGVAGGVMGVPWARYGPVMGAIGAAAGATATDLLTAATESVRRDPELARIVATVADGRPITAQEQALLSTSAWWNALPALAGNVAGLSSDIAEGVARRDFARMAVDQAAPYSTRDPEAAAADAAGMRAAVDRGEGWRGQYGEVPDLSAALTDEQLARRVTEGAVAEAEMDPMANPADALTGASLARGEIERRQLLPAIREEQQARQWWAQMQQRDRQRFLDAQAPKSKSVATPATPAPAQGEDDLFSTQPTQGGGGPVGQVQRNQEGRPQGQVAPAALPATPAAPRIPDDIRALDWNALRARAKAAGVPASEMRHKRNTDRLQRLLVEAEAAASAQREETLFAAREQMAQAEAQSVPLERVPMAAKAGKPSAVKVGEMELPAKFVALDIRSITPSHDPITAAKNPAYPHVNNRNRNEADDVADTIERSRNLKLGILLSQSYSNQEGGPIIDQAGNVLGGNGRTMAMLRAIREHPEQWARYVAERDARAAEFGIDPATLGPFDVIARQLNDDVPIGPSTNALIANFNVSESSALSAAEISRTIAARVPDNVIDSLNIQEGETVRAALRRGGGQLFQDLIALGIIPKSERKQYVDGRTGELEEHGIRVLEGAILDKMVGDADVAADLTDTMSDAILRFAGPSIAIRRAATPDRTTGRALIEPEWDLTKYMSEAIRLAVERGDAGQGSMLGVASNPVSDSLANLISATFRKRLIGGQAFQRMAERILNSNQADLFDIGEPPTLLSEIRLALSEVLTDKGVSTAQLEQAVARPATAPVAAPAAPKAPAAASLPEDLRGAAPKYAYGSKSLNVEFGDDVAKALYIVAQTKPSKRDADYMAWLRGALPGKTDDQIRQMGRDVRASLKDQAKGAKPGDTIKASRPTGVFELGSPSRRKGAAESIDLGSGPPVEPNPRIGMAPERPTGIVRIPMVSETIRSLESALDLKLLQGENLDPALAGLYRSRFGVASTRQFNDVDTIAHEVGHALDDRYRIGMYGDDPSAKMIDDELIPHFSNYGSDAKTLDELRMEGVAEWMAAYVKSPYQAESAAPTFARRYKALVSKADQKAISDYGLAIRTRAGAGGVAQQASVIQIDPPARMPTTEEVIAGVRANPRRWLSRAWSQVASALFDKNAAALGEVDEFLMRAGKPGIKALRAGEGVSPSDNFHLLNTARQGHPHILQDAIERGMPSADLDGTTRTNYGLPEMMALLVARGDKAQTKKNVETFLSYITARSTLARIDRARAEVAKQVAKADADIASLTNRIEGLRADLERSEPGGILNYQSSKSQIEAEIDRLTRARAALEASKASVVEKTNSRIYNWTGAGAGVESAEAVAQRAVDQVRSMNPVYYERITEAARMYKGYADSIVDFARDTGQITADAADRIKNSELVYAAMHRMGKSIDSKLFAEAGGSSRDIVNPFVSLMRQADAVIRRGMRNQALLAYVDLIDQKRAMYQGQPVQGAKSDLAVKVSKGTEGAVKVMRNGEEEWWQIPAPQRAIFDDDGSQRSTIKNVYLRRAVNLSKTVLDVMKRAIVTSPQFVLRSALREPVWSYIQGGSKPSDFLRYVIGGEANPDVKRFIQAGGSQEVYGLDGGASKDIGTYYGMQRAFMERALGERMGENVIVNAWRNVADGWKWYERNVVQRVENANRMSEWRRAYNEAKAKGYSGRDANLYAGYKARDMMNYAEMGWLVRMLNDTIPFFNPAMQGMRNTAKAFYRDPAKWMARAGVAVVLPEVLAYLWNFSQGEDAREEARQRESWKQDFFYNMKVAPNAWVMIPKPFEAGLLGSAVRRALDSMVTGENQMKGFEKSALRALWPVDPAFALAGGLAPIGEVATNYSFFQDRNIVPPNEVGRAMELRTTERASNLARVIAAAYNGTAPGSDIDPRQVDYIGRAYGSNWYWGAAGLSDVGRKDRHRLPSQWARIATGLVDSSPATDSEVAKRARDLIKTYGLSNSDMARRYYDKIQKLNEATTEAEREVLARELRDAAQSIIDSMAPEKREDILRRGREAQAKRIEKSSQ